ncbi:MAG: hypothetical protein VCC02_02150 [Myxococcota bacterium]
MTATVTRMAVLLALVAITGVVQARIEPVSDIQRGDAFIPRPEVAKAASIGFGALLADFYWLWAVQVVGDEVQNPAQHAAKIGRLVDVVTTLDPHVDHPYRFAAIWMTDSEASVREANRLLERGIAQHPDEWRNRHLLGFNHFFYLGEPARAADALEEAAVLPRAPAYLGRLAARLRSQGGSLEASALFLQQMLDQAHDDGSRAPYQAAFDEVEIEYSARALDRARERFEAERGTPLVKLAELLRGPEPVLEALPPAEPSSLPEGLRRGSRWAIDPETSEIFSTYTGRRYEPALHATDRKRTREWQDARRSLRETEDG